MTYYGNNNGYQGGQGQQGQGGYQGGYQQNDNQQAGYQGGQRDDYRGDSRDYQGNQGQGGYQGNQGFQNNSQGGYQGNQGGYQGHQGQGGYQNSGQQNNSQRPGLSESYYSEPSLNPQHQYSSQVQQGQGQHLEPNSDSYDQRLPVQQNSEQIDGPDGERGFMGAMAGGAAGAFGGHKLGGKTGHTKTSMLVGAMAGAFSGHKLQDAASDWKDERDEKKEREEEEEERRKEEEKRRRHEEKYGYQGPPPSGNHGHHGHGSQVDGRPRPGNYAGNFTGSSRDIRLDAHGDFLLHASCRREDGSYQHSSIPLARHLENDYGSFRWSGGRGQSGGSSVTVQHGDTLRTIASRFNCSYDEIARQNNIQNADMIYPGQTLSIPNGGNNGGNLGSSSRHLRLVDGGQRLEGELSRDGNWSLSSVILDERIRNVNGTLEIV